MLITSIGQGTQPCKMPEEFQMGVWRKRESRNSGPESRWPPGDPGKEVRAFTLKKK